MNENLKESIVKSGNNLHIDALKIIEGLDSSLKFNVNISSSTGGYIPHTEREVEEMKKKRLQVNVVETGDPIRLCQLRDQGCNFDGLIEQIEFWEKRLRELKKEEADKETAERKRK